MKAELEYQPRKQFVPFHQRADRWACMVCHRRAGKTVASVNEAVVRALYTPKKAARYAYIAPFYRQAKDVAWNYLKTTAKPFVASAKEMRESELRVRLLNGAWVTLYGADNPDALRGIYLDGVILDEFGDCRPSLWAEVVLPTLADRNGWAVFIGTPKGRNHFYKIHQRSKVAKGWFSLTLKASESGILAPATLDEMRAQMTDEQYRQEMECDFAAAVQGTYYADVISQLEDKRQIRKNHPEYDPELPVHVAADLGFSDSTAFWFWQHHPDGVAVIDYYENQGKPLDHYINTLRAKPYKYDAVWLPHDAKASTLQTGRTTVEQMLQAGLPCRLVPKLKVQHGIDAARMVLPHCHFNYTTTEQGVEALRAYRREYDETRAVFRDAPLHDWASDGADAFRYMALVARLNMGLPMRPESTSDKIAQAERRIFQPQGFSLEDLYDAQKTSRYQFEKMRI